MENDTSSKVLSPVASPVASSGDLSKFKDSSEPETLQEAIDKSGKREKFEETETVSSEKQDTGETMSKYQEPVRFETDNSSSDTSSETDNTSSETDNTSSEVYTSTAVENTDGFQYFADLHSRVELLKGTVILLGALIGVLLATVFFDIAFKHKE